VAKASLGFGRSLGLEQQLSLDAVDLRLPIAFPASFHRGESFRHESERFVRLPRLAISRGELAKSTRPKKHLCSQAPHSSQADAHLGDSLLHLSLLGLCPPPTDGSPIQRELKPVLGRDRNRRLGALLGQWPFFTEVTSPGSPKKSKCQAERMSDRTGRRQSFLALLQSLIWVTKMPECYRGPRVGDDPR